MTIGVTEHSPDVVQEQWAALTFQHGRHDGCEGALCFESEDAAIAYARDNWAARITHDNNTEHEIVVLKVVRVFRGPRSWADL